MLRHDFIPGLVFQVTREQRAVMERRLARFDVTLQQASVLIRARGQETSPHELAAALGTDNAGMTRLLDRLEAKGLVARRSHPSDRRSITIGLTEVGAGLAPRLGPVLGSVSRDMLAGFSAEETAALGSLLGRLLDNLRNAPGDDEARSHDLPSPTHRRTGPGSGFDHADHPGGGI
jgi:DNA-binding MarR family transcriptional regulator